ncbi:MAG TPA: cytochrome c oxidase assembly protein [Stellaceae bacterium]|nr:cytochrome c oxidase assembly protein [Stellaceae bacterium]
MRDRRRKNLIVLAGLGGILAAMLTLVSYSVPLYRLFCAATGLGGATQRVQSDGERVSSRMITVDFTTTVMPGLAWRFTPVVPRVTLHLGEEKLVFFRAENLTDKPLVGHATFNVAPAKTGIYFKKIQCFCFSEERLGPRQAVEMPVDFFVDPRLARDPDTREVREITLSYAFFPSLAPQKARDLARFSGAAEPDPARGKRLFAERCAACHALDRNKVGPMLGGVLGRKAGAVAGYPYSQALRAAALRWTAGNLDKWLAGPQEFVPGALMPARILEAPTRRDIIAYLEEEGRKTAAVDGTGKASP